MRAQVNQWGGLLSFCLGALAILSFAPFNFWPLWFAIIPALLTVIEYSPKQKRAKRLYGFALGYWLFGVGWIHHSIYNFGNLPWALSALATLMFCAFMALLWWLPFLAWLKIRSRKLSIQLLSFPSIWVLGEWSREWFLTGFPWLQTAHGLIDSPFSGYATIGGTLLVSWVVIFLATLLSHWLRHPKQMGAISFFGALLIFVALGWQFKQVPWTQPDGEPMAFTVIQPNVDQDIKWQPQYREQIVNQLWQLTRRESPNSVIFWPEAALPIIAGDHSPLLSQLDDLAATQNLHILGGVPTRRVVDGNLAIRNSIVALGDSSGVYDKQQLVPFGEYIPLIDLLGPIFMLFDLPVGSQAAGLSTQQAVTLNGRKVTPAVCYEVAYGSLIAASSRDSQFLSNHSNDTWFGDTLGPIQHFEIARWRAIETHRPMVRVTNNGISALINRWGGIEISAQRFVATRFDGTLQPRKGTTPFQYWLNLPLVCFCFLMLLTALLLHRKKR